MLNIRQLGFQYAPSAESMCFDLEVEAGEIISLIGPSGSGKTTLLNLIAGFLSPQQGSVHVNKQMIQALPAAKRPVSMVFQEHNLFPHLNVWTNVAVGIDPSLKLNPAQQQAIDQALTKLGLEALQQRKPGELSGGQRQRVALARALVRKQPVLLLDEPFAALGPAQREEMIGLVKTMVDQQNMAALLVSHQPDDALLASARTAFINHGRIIKVASTEQLLNDSGISEIRQYLGTP